MKKTSGASMFLAAAAGAFTATTAFSQTTKADDATVLDTVVVTAQKRSQSAQEVPISMTVVGEDQLEKAHASTLMDLQQLAPNFEAVQAPGTASVSVRGVGGGGRNIGFDTRVGIYVDGIYLGQAQALGQPLFDIEQVEVLRGPQGYLFGRNTVAGAVNITTRAPTREFEGSLRAVAGNYGAVEAYGTVSGPISEKLLGKISVATESRDGIASNNFNGQKLNNLDRMTTRGQLSLLASDKLKINLLADYSDTKQDLIMGEPTTGLGGAPLAGGPLPHGVVNFNTTPFTNVTLSGASLNISYALDNGNTLTSITGYRRTRQDRANDTDYGPADIFKILYKDDFKQSSQEIRVVSPNSGRVRYVGGIYYLQETADTLRTASSGADAALARLPLGLVGTNAGTLKTTTSALFGSLDVELINALMLNLGARYTSESKDILYNLNGAAALGIATLVNYTDTRSEHRLTPMVGLSYAVDKNTNLYTKASTGFKSGGWNADFVNAAQVAGGLNFDTETVRSYELGMKGQLLGARMQYDLAAFTSNFDNYQTFFFIPNGPGRSTLQLKNAAKVESNGLEASTRVRVTSNLKLGLNIGLLHTTYKSFPDGGGIGVDLSGQRVADTPDLTVALTLDYGVPVPTLGGRFDVYMDYSHRDGTTLTGTTFAPLSARDIVNLRLSYGPNNAKWSASLWARNLTNQDYVLARGADFLRNSFDTRGLPRTFGLEAKYNF